MKNETVADVLLRFPGGARILERHRIDYCCRGWRPFDEACAAAGVIPEDLLDELRRAVRPVALPDWTSLTPAELCDEIERVYHRPLDEELPRLEALARRVRDVHGERHPELVSVWTVFVALKDELERHMKKEEQVLFPMIRRIGAAPPPPIQVMRHEHEDAGTALSALRKLTGDYRAPSDACASYRALYQGLAELEHALFEHIHVENNILFPQALEGIGRSPTRFACAR